MSKHLDISTRNIIYRSFVQCNFDFCPLVWHFCGKLNNNKLEKIHERALRIVNKDFDSSYEDIIITSKTTTVLISRLRVLLCEVFKSLYKLNPNCINELFEVKELGYSFRNCKKVYQPVKRTTTYGLRSFSYTGAKLWNDFCPKLAEDVDLNEFKMIVQNLDVDSLDPNFNYV